MNNPMRVLMLGVVMFALTSVPAPVDQTLERDGVSVELFELNSAPATVDHTSGLGGVAVELVLKAPVAPPAMVDRTRGLGGVIAGLVLNPPVAAQNGGGGGVTCGWCIEGRIEYWDFEKEEWILEFEHGHYFPWGGDECGWIGNGGGNGGSNLAGDLDFECRRCGGDSSCHTEPDDGPCHLECGPGGGDLLAAAIADLQDSIDHQDVPGIVRVVQATSLLEFSPRDGAVIAVGSCHDSEDSTVFALPAGLAERLSAAVRQAK